VGGKREPYRGAPPLIDYSLVATVINNVGKLRRRNDGAAEGGSIIPRAATVEQVTATSRRERCGGVGRKGGKARKGGIFLFHLRPGDPIKNKFRKCLPFVMAERR